MKRRHVLISNDDGIEARGIQLLASVMVSLPDTRVTVVAPSDQQSASSHSLTLTRPLRILERGEGRYAVTGTPTDSVLVAVEKILKDDPPDIVLSGVNHGPNMGEDVIYSGTVAAAMEGAILGIPSVAISLASWHPTDFSGAEAFLREWLPGILDRPLQPGMLLNINVPEGPPRSLRGVRVVRLGTRVYHDVITDQTDPRGKPYFWIGGHGPTWSDDPDTDHAAVESGFVSITPLVVDFTHYQHLAHLEHLERTGHPAEAENGRA
jgi:5'-nucleotidase